MEPQAFFAELDRRIAQYDLLCHPFYQAWSAGTLTRTELREYAGQYYNHVAAFPAALGTLHARLEEGELRRAVRENYQDEVGVDSPDGRPHDELWLDFVAGMDTHGTRSPRQPLPEMCDLMELFRDVAHNGSPAEALAAFYAYESQVPRVATEKARGLRAFYGASDATCRYFDLHQTADVHHSAVWREQLGKLVSNDAGAGRALTAAESAAKALWRALDGIERERLAQRAA
ncbi:MAG: iron-containing redox enzyme family protein [Candidatus Koribacter versatilis]|uniref:Iron-containing redox enzyme family protein n=1 Tax=Candidatus Korobacter versatilis TaxID=658062 RepID=A0A932EPW8_9BACT|nr:iron-containing redox enzyme family protein [Candidatus Koribacter versatilis]